jgi:hypothetical protein
MVILAVLMLMAGTITGIGVILMILFHDGDNEHVPFPHRVQVIRDGTEFIVCAECDHWITREVPECSCSQRCHELARIIASLRTTE